MTSSRYHSIVDIQKNGAWLNFAQMSAEASETQTVRVCDGTVWIVSEQWKMRIRCLSSDNEIKQTDRRWIFYSVEEEGYCAVVERNGLRCVCLVTQVGKTIVTVTRCNWLLHVRWLIGWLVSWCYESSDYSEMCEFATNWLPFLLRKWMIATVVGRTGW